MQITHKYMVSGVLDTGVEFFAVANNKVQAFHNGRLWTNFESMPKSVHDVIRREMNNPAATTDEMERFAFEHFGKLDFQADINETGDVCNYETLNEQPSFDNGVPITAAQMRVLNLIELNIADIATILFRSEFTVARQIQDMKRNSGFPTTKALAIWAAKKQII